MKELRYIANQQERTLDEVQRLLVNYSNRVHTALSGTYGVGKTELALFLGDLVGKKVIRTSVSEETPESAMISSPSLKVKDGATFSTLDDNVLLQAMKGGDIYDKRTFNERSYAFVVVVDNSLTTSEWLFNPIESLEYEGKTKRVISVMKEAALLLGDAIDTINDPFAIYAYHSIGETTYVQKLKTFSDPWEQDAQAYVAGVNTEGANRDGAAIRYIKGELDKTGASDKVMFFITDGKPDVPDTIYGGEYAHNDLFMALDECKNNNTAVIYVNVKDVPEGIEEHASKVIELVNPEEFGLKLRAV